MHNNYIHSTPVSVVRVIAGFNADGESYALCRSWEPVGLLKPEVKKYVFPWAEVALEHVVAATERVGVDKVEDLASCNVLKSLIDYGRIVVLEDLASLSMRQPNHPYVLRFTLVPE